MIRDLTADGLKRDCVQTRRKDSGTGGSWASTEQDMGEPVQPERDSLMAGVRQERIQSSVLVFQYDWDQRIPRGCKILILSTCSLWLYRN